MNTGSGHQAKWLGIFLTVCVVAVFGACQGGSKISSPGVAPPTSGEAVTLERMLADLDELSPPMDVDLQLFEELKQSLATALTNLGEQRFVSLAPYSDLSAVTDFSIQGNADGTASLTWTYQSQGDYDQNSEVNVADLTPIVVNFGATPAGENWVKRSVADGDNNGEVNTTDITPIATNYARTVSGYRVFTSLTPFDDSSWVAAGEDVLFNVGVIPEGLSRRGFEYKLFSPISGNYYRVEPYHITDTGQPRSSADSSVPTNSRHPPFIWHSVVYD